MPVPAHDVPQWLVVAADTLFYVTACAGLLIPAVVALWIKLVDVPHLRASNHALVNGITAVGMQAQRNAMKTDAVKTTVDEIAEKGAPVDETH